MPKFDGRDATIQLRNAGYTHPIVALTANVTEQEQRRCMAAGCNGFLAKPVDQAELLRTMQQFASPEVRARIAAAKVAELASDAQIAAVNDSFRAEIPSRIAEIAGGIFAGDMARVAELSHRLKGTASCFGFSAVGASADALQTAAERAETKETIEQCFRALSEQGSAAVLAKAA